MSFFVLLGGTLPLLLMLFGFQGIVQRKYRRLGWCGAFLLTDLLFTAAYIAHRYVSLEASLVWNSVAFAALLGSMVLRLATPREQR